MLTSSDPAARPTRSTIRLFGWILVWVGTLILVDKAVLYGWYTSDFISVLGIVINAGMGLGVIVTFLRFLREIDEMQRKIQLDSLALSMGIGFVGSFSYTLLVTTGFVADPEVRDIILLMAGTYMASLIVGQFRYR